MNEIQIDNKSSDNNNNNNISSNSKIDKKHISLREPPKLAIDSHNSNSCPSFNSNPSSPSTLRKTKTKKSCDDYLVDALQEVLSGDLFDESNEAKEKRKTKRANNNKIDFSELEKESQQNKKNNKKVDKDDPFISIIKQNSGKTTSTNPSSNDLSVFDDLFK